MTQIDPKDPLTVAESMNDSFDEWLKNLEFKNYRISKDDMELAAGFLRTYLSVNRTVVSDLRSKEAHLKTIVDLLTK